MARRGRRGVPADVKAVLRRIEHWRKTRERRSPMPEELWEAAVSVAQEYGVWSVAHDLRVNYESLKSRVELATGQGSGGAAPSGGFVEVAAEQLLGPSAAAVTVVELSAADGAKLTVRVEGGAELDVQALVERFWQRDG